MLKKWKIIFCIAVLMLVNTCSDKYAGAVGISLDFASHEGGIYRARCLFQGNRAEYMAGYYLVAGSRSHMGLSQREIQTPVPAWARCQWKSNVDLEWDYDDAEKYGISRVAYLDLLALIPPSVIREILTTSNSKDSKIIDLGLDFDGATLYPRWSMFIWSPNVPPWERRNQF